MKMVQIIIIIVAFEILVIDIFNRMSFFFLQLDSVNFSVTTLNVYYVFEFICKYSFKLILYFNLPWYLRVL